MVHQLRDFGDVKEARKKLLPLEDNISRRYVLAFAHFNNVNLFRWRLRKQGRTNEKIKE